MSDSQSLTATEFVAQAELPPDSTRRKRDDADELRALQAPVKERYRQDPAVALVTLRAEGKLGER